MLDISKVQALLIASIVVLGCTAKTDISNTQTKLTEPPKKHMDVDVDLTKNIFLGRCEYDVDVYRSNDGMNCLKLEADEDCKKKHGYTREVCHPAEEVRR